MVKRTKSSILMVLYLLLGAVTGYLLVAGRLNSSALIEFSPWIRYDYDIVFGIIAISCIIMTVWNVIGLSTLSIVPNNEQEDTDGGVTPQERKLGTLLQVSSFNQIISFVWAVLAIVQFINQEGSAEEEKFLIINVLAGSIVVILTIILQYITVNRFNKMYPDRTLDLTAVNGQREFTQKLDDGEKWIAYRSAFKAFNTVNTLLVVGILFFFVYSLLFTPAPLPIIVLAIIQIVQKYVYFREVSKYSNKV